MPSKVLSSRVSCMLIVCFVAAAAPGSARGADVTAHGSIATNKTVHQGATLPQSSANDTSRPIAQFKSGISGAHAHSRHITTSAQQTNVSAAPDLYLQLESFTAPHTTRRFVILSTIFPLTVAPYISPTQATSSPQHQHHHQQLSTFRIKVSTCPIPPLQTEAPSTDHAATTGCRKAASAVTYHALKPVGHAAEPQPLRVALLLPMPSHNSSNSSTAAAAGPLGVDSSTQPLLLTIHVQQRTSGYAYLWIGSHLILPGASSAAVSANMSDNVYSWLIRPSALSPAAAAETVPAWSAAAEATAAPTAAEEEASAAQAITEPAVTDNIPTNAETPANNTGTQNNNWHTLNDLSAASNEDESETILLKIQNTGNIELKHHQQQQQQQLGLSGPSAAASICAALPKHLPACAAADAATTAYAVAGMLNSDPHQAAWIAAVLTQNKQAQQLLRKQQQQGLEHGSHSGSSSSSGSVGSDHKRQTCPAWPMMHGIEMMMVKSCLAATVNEVPAVAYADAAAALQDKNNNSNSSSSSDSGGRGGCTVYLALLGPYLEPYITCDSSSTLSFTVHAALDQVLLVLAGLLLATAASCAVICSRSSRRGSAAAPAAVLAAQSLMQGKTQEQVYDSCTKQQSNRKPQLSCRDQDCDDDEDDLQLFGRSALDQLEQQLEDSQEGADQDDYSFGYGGAAAAAATAAATAAAAAQGVTGAVSQAVHRASAAAAAAATGPAVSIYKAALGTNTTAAAAAGMPGTMAAAMPSTAAKLAAGYWDSVDEEAVNQLPANIQDQLQAGGRWTRDAGGRLIRGSIRAFRAASNRAAAAVSAALSGGAAAAAAAAAEPLQQQQQQGLAGEDKRNADLLRQLLAAGPGVEIVSSDDER